MKSLFDSYFLIIILLEGFKGLVAADSSKTEPSFSDIVIERKMYTFSAIADTATIVSFRNHHFVPFFRYKMTELNELTNNSIIVAGMDAHWKINFKKVKFLNGCRFPNSYNVNPRFIS